MPCRMAYLFRIYNSYLGANILMYDKMDESEYSYSFVTTVFYNGMMTNKGIYQMPIMNGETTGQYGLPVATCGASRYALSDKSSFGGSFGIVQITI